MKQNITEQMLLSLLVLLLVAALIASVIYGVSLFYKLKSPEPQIIKPQPKSAKFNAPKKQISDEEEYNRIVEKSKQDYRLFMEQQKSKSQTAY